MRIGWVILVLLLYTLGCGDDSTPNSTATSTHKIVASLLPTGDILVKESITISSNVGVLTRSLWLSPVPHAWPLLLRIDDVSVTDSEGKNRSFRKRAYEERVNIDFLEIPQDGLLVLQYTIHRAIELTEEPLRWDWNIAGHGWDASISEVELRIEHPNASSNMKMSYHVGYSTDVESIAGEAVQENGGTVFRFQPHSTPNDSVSFVVVFPKDGIGPIPKEWMQHDLLDLFGTSVYLFAIVLFLAFLQLLLWPTMAIGITRFTNLAATIPVCVAAYGVAHFWYHEPGNRGFGNDFIGESMVHFGLAGFILSFAIKQSRLLGEKRRAAYFSQLAYPFILMIAWPIAFTDRSMLVFPLLALPVFLYWPRKKIALEFGVGIHRIGEIVSIEGEISFSDVSKRLGIRRKSLVRILEQCSGLPIVVDYVGSKVMSAETASLFSNLQVCGRCGGLTSSEGMASLVCGYCRQKYTSMFETKGDTPLPVVVESIAISMETLAGGILFISVLIALSIFAMETLDGSLIGGLIGGAISGFILLLPAMLFYGISSGLREGNSVGIVRFVLLLMSPLIFPFFLWLRLRSKRVRLFFKEWTTKELEAALVKEGEWSLADFANYLQTNQEDAAELAQYLVANHIIDAVYERRHGRLVSRALYRQIATEEDCMNCGGYFGVHGGKAQCHYCGESPGTGQTTSPNHETL